jgi:hypothetical protein
LLQQDHDGHLTGQAGHARYPEISSIELSKALQAIIKFENLIMHPISSATALTCASILLKKVLHERSLRKYRAAHKRWLQECDYKRQVAFAKEMIK